MRVSRTTKLTLAYDGGPFAGWAVQPGQRTVAGELSVALQTVLREEVSLVVAGRTDRGVHALGQVVSYDGPLPSLRSVNALLPDEIAVLSAEERPGRLQRPPRRGQPLATSTASWPAPRRRRSRPAARSGGRIALDRAALDACAAALAGTHDFTAFTPTETYHQRFERNVLSAAWQGDELLEFRIEADAFMRQMNRVLVGTMLEVANGRRTLESFERLLDGPPARGGGADGAAARAVPGRCAVLNRSSRRSSVAP